MGESDRNATQLAALVAREEASYRERNSQSVALAARGLPGFYGGVT